MQAYKYKFVANYKKNCYPGYYGCPTKPATGFGVGRVLSPELKTGRGLKLGVTHGFLGKQWL